MSKITKTWSKSTSLREVGEYCLQKLRGSWQETPWGPVLDMSNDKVFEMRAVLELALMAAGFRDEVLLQIADEAQVSSSTAAPFRATTETLGGLLKRYESQAALYEGTPQVDRPTRLLNIWTKLAGS